MCFAMNILPPFHNNLDYQMFSDLCLENSIEFRIVGGCSRNLILKRNSKDIDIAVNINIEDFIKILDFKKIKYNPHAKNYGSIIVYLENRNIEVTSLRIDFNQSGRKTKIKFTSSWYEDSLRRDFTINAIYIDYFGKVYDFHNGIKDLKEQRIQFIGEPLEKIQQDYLRILRYYRMKGYFKNPVQNSKVEEEINQYLKKMTAEINKELLLREIIKMQKMDYYKNCFFVNGTNTKLPWVEYLINYWEKINYKIGIQKCFKPL